VTGSRFGAEVHAARANAAAATSALALVRPTPLGHIWSRIILAPVRKIALLAGGAAAFAVAALVLGLRAAGKAQSGGFFGPGPLAADVNLTLEIALVVGLSAGMLFARAGRIETHRVNQTIWALVNAALVACVMIPSLTQAKLARLSDLAHWSSALPWLHSAIGAVTVLAALWLVLQMNDVLPERWHIARWKTLMRCTLAGFWIVAVLGILLYFQAYVG
jgi:hypothetical protein